VYCHVTLRPSPAAVTENVYQLGDIVAFGSTVSVDVPTPDLIATGLLLHEVAMELGSPDTVSVTLPVKEPPVVMVNKSVTLVLCFAGMCVTAGEKFSEGGVDAWQTDAIPITSRRTLQ
jgi:hypothetical protein